MKYERLTKRDEFNNADIIGLSTEKLFGELFFNETNLLTTALNRLAELEDKIENGTLIELPCKVGDTLWYVNMYAPTPRIEENKVHTIEMFECMTGLTIRIWTQNGTFYAENMPNVFKTKSEAEKKLKELHNEY